MNSSHRPEQHPDLFALVKGELSNDAVLAAGDHLEGCAPCREELVDTLVGHALLARAVHTMSSTPPVTDPWDARDLPALAAPVRRGRGFLLAAAATVAVGAVAVGALTLGSGDDPQQAPPVAAPAQVITLDAVEGTATGEVTMVRDDRGTLMTISAPDLPGTDARHFYQAWLLDPATNKMLSLGLVSGDGTTFRVDDELLAAYGAVDVSLEADDGDPQHSVTSVLRGSYEPTV
ncbi:anti-sigma factor [Nocardioides psychrotolerans]|uniref:anti-sigma factor n=1 Tax=Nocardioides psychrotolerans TaxID=1005945 RepID=UPI0031378C92